jgi:hypothetical protein
VSIMIIMDDSHYVDDDSMLLMVIILMMTVILMTIEIFFCDCFAVRARNIRVPEADGPADKTSAIL